MTPNNKHYVRCLEALKESEIFNKLAPLSLHAIMKEMVREKWSINTFKESSEVKSTLHFIISGRLKVYQINPNTGREHTIFILNRGDIFDILTLLDSEDHQVYWEAIDELEILRVSVTSMRNLINTYPKLNQEIMLYLGQRMRLLESESSDICLHNTLTRLAKMLLKYINTESHKLEIINDLPNDEIASMIGTTRAVINRHIQELKKAGAITTKRSHIYIHDLQALIAIAEEKYPL